MPLDRFITAVRRRMTLVRVLERAGLTLLAAALVCLVLMAVLLYRGQPTAGVPAVPLIVAAFGGAAWGFVTRPSRLRAAIEADRQLGLSDLLSTATALRRARAGSGDDSDSFVPLVLSRADAVCARLAPATVRTHRMGPRSWGGVGLALAMVGTLALLGADPARSQAAGNQLAAAGPKSWLDQEPQSPDAGATRNTAAPDLRRPRTGTAGDDADPLRSPTGGSSEAAPPDGASTANPSTGGNAEGSGGSGAGSAQSAAKSPHDAGPGSQATPPPGSSGARPDGSGGPAGTGSGGSGSARTGIAGSSGGTGGEEEARRAVPPWRSTEWGAAQRSAEQALVGGRVPDAYRGMVRDYFAGE